MERPETDDTLDRDLSFYQHLSTSSFPGVALRTMDNAGNKTLKEENKKTLPTLLVLPSSGGMQRINTGSKVWEYEIGLFLSIGWSGKSSKR